jgi:hypothetical protein
MRNDEKEKRRKNGGGIEDCRESERVVIINNLPLVNSKNKNYCYRLQAKIVD